MTALSNLQDVGAIVNGQVVLQPPAAQTANFGIAMVVGSSPVLSMAEGVRTYSGSTALNAIAADFGTTANEYLAAQKFFSQSPQPQTLMIARYAKTATAGQLQGATLTSAQQVLANWTVITSGQLEVTVAGTQKTATGINLSGATNLNGVASLITTALAGVATVTWNAAYARFEVQTTATGTTAAIGFFTSGSADAGLAQQLGLTVSTYATISNGVAAETPLAAIARILNMTAAWYAVEFADQLSLTDALAVANFVEASGLHIFGYTVTDTGALNASTSTDAASQLKAANLNRTFMQYSSNTPFAAMSLFGRAATVNFLGNKTTLTLMFKQEPTVVAETLTASQAASLQGKNCNVFVAYNNQTNILQFGTMASGQYFDTIHGCDWLQNYIQTAVWNLLYQSGTKIPQTDAGVNQILSVIEQCMQQAVANGLVAPGVWTAGGFGALSQDDYLQKGYYIYAPPVATQSAADRGARKAPVIQIAIKLAGAIHTVNFIINVNA